MLICVPDVLSKEAVAQFRSVMDAAEWEGGASTAGAQPPSVKSNEQLPPNGELSRRLGERLLQAIVSHPGFVSAAISLRIYPPMFNRYRVGHRFGVHVDNAVRGDPLTGTRIRADLAVTVFLSEPEEYDGGELVVDDAYDSSSGQASGGRARRLSGERSAHGLASHAGDAHRLFLLGAEHDPPGERARCDL